MPKLNEDLINL